MSRSTSQKSGADFSLYPLLWLSVCLAAGILTARIFDFDWKISFAAAVVLSVLTVIFLKQRAAVYFVGCAFLAAGAFVYQAENQNLPDSRIKQIYDQKIVESNAPVKVEGILRGKPELSVGGFFLPLDAEILTFNNEARKVSGRVKLFAVISDEQTAAEYEQLNLQYGSKIRVACRLQRENNYLNPGVLTKIERLDEQEIDADAIIKSPLLIEKIEDTPVFLPLAWVYEQRQNLIVEFRDKFSVSTAGVLIASLLGDRYFLDKPTADVFREGGIFHILVISGLHITLIGGLILFLTRFLTKNRFWQFAVAASVLWAFALSVGAEIPVVRAALMFTILSFSQVVYRHGTLLNSLGACALILLIRRPDDLFSSSFQLTLASVGAIVAAAFPLVENLRSIGSWSPSPDAPFPPNVSVRLKTFCETLYWREEIGTIEIKRQIWSARLFKSPSKLIYKTVNVQKLAAYLFEGVAVSLIAQISLLPLAVIFFHRISLISIVLNLWVGFFIALETVAAVCAVTAARFSDLSALPLIKLTEIFNWFLLALPNLFVQNDWASFRLPAYSGWAQIFYLLYFASVISLAVNFSRWRPFDLVSQLESRNNRRILSASFASLLVLLAIIVFHPAGAARADGKMHVDFLDVGQGDAALLTFPDGQTMLIDGGGKMNFSQKYVENETDDEPEFFVPDTQTIGESVVSPFLWSKGLDKIDYILATHADADHIQGLTAVAENFRIRTAFFGRMPIKNANFAELEKVLNRKNISSVKLKRGDTLNFGGAVIEVLYPENDDNPNAESDNNHSLTLRLTYGNKRFLFTGDIEREAEHALLQSPAYLRAEFVKVAHHGSRTSSTAEFIGASKAEYAIISVGKKSRFGHPHREVVERWRQSGAKVLTTGERGTISILTDGKNLEIQTFIR